MAVLIREPLMLLGHLELKLLLHCESPPLQRSIWLFHIHRCRHLLSHDHYGLRLCALQLLCNALNIEHAKISSISRFLVSPQLPHASLHVCLRSCCHRYRQQIVVLVGLLHYHAFRMSCTR